MMATAGAIDVKFDVIAGAKRAVVVDLSNVAFMASPGIRLLVMGAKTIARRAASRLSCRWTRTCTPFSRPPG